MKAIVQHGYGSPDVLSMEEIDPPAAGPDDIVLRVHAAGVCYPDLVVTRGVPYLVRLQAGLRHPRHPVRGSEVAGMVTAVGSHVTDLHVGDEVFGWCGGHAGGGGFAEYARLPANGVAPKPPGLTFAQAAALPLSGVTALQAVRDWGEVHPGQKVLINGASGGVGTFAVQIAKALGAHVTGVCSSRNVALVRSLGADAVIDYTRKDFTRETQRYDVILDFPHYATRSLKDLRRAMTPRGTLIPASNTPNRWIGGFGRILRGRAIAPFVSQRIRSPEMTADPADLAALANLVNSGAVTPVIDQTYTLEEVPEALHRFAKGHTWGKLVVVVMPDAPMPDAPMPVQPSDELTLEVSPVIHLSRYGDGNDPRVAKSRR